MACRSGFGNCNCFETSDWEFRVTFRFEGVDFWDIEHPLVLADLLNCTAMSGETAERENVTREGVLTQEGIITPEFVPGTFVFLQGAELTRSIRKGQLIEVKTEEGYPLDRGGLIARLEAAYPLPPAYMLEVLPDLPRHRHAADPVGTLLPMVTEIIVPPVNDGEKIAHGTLFGHIGEEWQYPAVYERAQEAGVDGNPASSRHFQGNGIIEADRDYPAGTAIVIRPPFGPYRGDTRGLFQEVPEVPPGTPWGIGGDTQAYREPFAPFKGVNYYFKREFTITTQNWENRSDYFPVKLPGSDWLASQLWTGKSVTVSGRVFTP